MLNFKKLSKPLVLIGILGSTGAFADEEISACGAVISTPGHYRLSQNLDCSGQPNPIAIRILNTSDVELDLDGYWIKGRPNQTYGGTGTGIYVYNSSDVEIDGSQQGSRIYHFKYGIRYQNSDNGKVDGDFMTLDRNAEGVFVQGGSGLLIKQVRLANVQRDIHLSQTQGSKVRRTFHKGVTQQGILVNQSTNTEIEDAKIGYRQKVKFGVIFYNSSDSLLKESEIDQADIAVSLSGQGTQNTELKDNRFGRDNANACDLRVAFGAEDPELDDNSPQQLSECS